MFFGNNTDPKTNVLLYCIATILFAISAITNFIGGNVLLAALSLLGFVVIFKTYLKLRKEYKETQKY